jgi:parvulin-like peptidyl-prolyl isomerase
MKNKPILFAAMAATAVCAAVIITRSVHAAAPDTTATGTTMAASSTNSSDDMAALFGDPVIASGTGISVKRSDLDKVVTDVKAAAAAQNETIPEDRLILYEARALQQMIDVQLLLQQASAADKADGAKKADEAMALLLKKAGSKETLDMQLTAAGTTEAQLRNKVVQQATAMAALQRELGVTVSDAEIQKFYDTHPQEFEQPEMVHVRHILLMTIDPATGTPLSDDVVQEKRKQADGILARARAGEDFAKLAEEYSDDTTTKFKGGDLPPFPRASADPNHAMLPEFEEAAFSLTNNQISDIVQTRYGFHIIQLLDKVPARKLALTDKVPSSETTVGAAVKDGMMQQKTEQLATPFLDKLKKTADVKILDPDLSAAVQQLAIAATNTPAATASQAPPDQSAPPAPSN